MSFFFNKNSLKGKECLFGFLNVRREFFVIYKCFCIVKYVFVFMIDLR